jgi:ribosomal protein S15P/S13E
MLKSVINPESLIKESDIQYKYESYNLLLEALVGIYAKIYEDYFGKFSFKDIKKILTTDLKVKIDPGKFFTKKLNMIIFQLNLSYGLLYLEKLFQNMEKYHNKSDYFDLKFLMNYLADYLEETNYESPEMLIQSFHLPNNFQKFIDFLMDKFGEESFKKKLKGKITKFFNKLQAYLNGDRKRRPSIPDELYLLKDKNIKILRTIAENVTKSDRKSFIRGDHKDKNHISKDFNLEKISEKELDSLIEDISNLKEHLKDDIDYLLKKISYDPPQYTHREKIISNMVDDVKEIIWEEIDNHTLSEYDFEDINKIRIRSILNTTHYELPIDIKMYLINEGRYDGETVRKLIESSTTVSDSFRKCINKSLLTEESYEDLLNAKLKKNGSNKVYFPVSLHIPKEISGGNKNTIFGKNAIWNNGGTELLGFKLPIENPEVKKYAEALNIMVKNEIYDELESLMNLIDNYSKEIHTGFEKVYERIFQ